MLSQRIAVRIIDRMPKFNKKRKCKGFVKRIVDDGLHLEVREIILNYAEALNANTMDEYVFGGKASKLDFFTERLMN